MPKHYHYIITGAGCAGSSLLLRMMKNSFFQDKKILIIDQAPKTENDRTWCFWEKTAGLFGPIVHHQWEKVNFFSNTYSATLDLFPYRYKMIRGIDLYSFVKNESANHVNIEWRYEKVRSINSDVDKATVISDTGSFTSNYVFNSILFDQPKVTKGKYLLLQHFKGWVIETKKPSFDPQLATFMDFRVSQKHGTAFIYLMPTSATTALVEYTLFTEALLPKEQYDAALQEYISSLLQISDYTITHQEFGVIPMTNTKFPLQQGRIVYTGIAGGQAKGSSGYAFQFIQKRADQIIKLLVADKQPLLYSSWNDKKFHLYDSILLNVLYHHKMKGDEIFGRIFQKTSMGCFLRFLDNETDLREDLKVIRSLPTGIFLPAALQELFK